MKTYVLMVSKTFPQTHIKRGKSTGFVESISGLFLKKDSKKIHTIRGNYEAWKKKESAINKGDAVLSIRYWNGKPYRSNQVEIVKLTSLGVQKLEHPDNLDYATVDGKQIEWTKISENDGLRFEDFCEWFKDRPIEPMAILHFTNFRY